MVKITIHKKTPDKGVVTELHEFKTNAEAESAFEEFANDSKITFIKMFETTTGEILRRLDK